MKGDSSSIGGVVTLNAEIVCQNLKGGARWRRTPLDLPMKAVIELTAWCAIQKILI